MLSMGMNRILNLAVVWSLMASTLATGLPHITCLCPNGNRKEFCFGIASNHGGCCCDNGICCSKVDGRCCDEPSRPTAQPSEQCCCVKNAKAKADRSLEPQLKDDSPCCKKAWNQ